jgi:hypothetical protein
MAGERILVVNQGPDIEELVMRVLELKNGK